MKRIAAPLLVALLALPGGVSAQDPIGSVEYEGLNRTDAEYLENFTTSREGQTFDSLAFVEDLRALRNLQLFRTVEGEVRRHYHRVDLLIRVSEKTTLLPIVGYQSIGDNYKLRLGAVDQNFLGNGSRLGGYYEYYQRHSFELFYGASYVRGSRFGWTARVARFATLEPAYFDGEVASYDVDRLSLETAVLYDFSPVVGRGNRFLLSTGVELLKETYEKDLEVSGEGSPGPPGGTFDKYLFKSSFTFAKLDYSWHRVSGVRNRTFLEAVSDGGEGMSFLKASNVTSGFLPLTETLDVAGRLILGLSTNRASPFAPFVIDSYENVRGSGNRVARGTGQVVLNAELRQTLFRGDRLAVELTGFLDYGTLRPGGGSWAAFFSDATSYAKGGAGLRVHLFQYYGSTLRLDYAFGIDGGGGLILGLGQYF